MFCIGCDYPLVGLSSQCPECGRPFDPKNPNTFAAESRKTRRYQTLCAISVACGTLSLVAGFAAFLAALSYSPEYEFLGKPVDLVLLLLLALGLVVVPSCSLIAIGVGIPAFVLDRKEVRPILDDWIEHRDLWLRRTAIIAQIKHKEQTDEPRLFDYCRRRAFEKEFFIRKAIGWALREHAKTRPRAVARFLKSHRDELSGLSYREAAKHLK